MAKSAAQQHYQDPPIAFNHAGLTVLILSMADGSTPTATKTQRLISQSQKSLSPGLALGMNAFRGSRFEITSEVLPAILAQNRPSSHSFNLAITRSPGVLAIHYRSTKVKNRDCG
ncbi:hypothetical protein VTL71DRAFT_3591 [Oculimacula yallundae]|uniref:Uncharacterized protein n=1 Tax=Oculimacula yallundae TaxID=86028 RepID=A0ABR4C7L1_9HELO